MRAQQQRQAKSKGRRGRGLVVCFVWFLGILLGVYVAELILHTDIRNNDKIDMAFLGLESASGTVATSADKSTPDPTRMDDDRYIYKTDSECHAYRTSDGKLGPNWGTWTEDAADQRCSADHETADSCNKAKGWCHWETFTLKVLKMPPPPPSPPSPPPNPPPPPRITPSSRYHDRVSQGLDISRGIHTVCTSNGSPYLNFQARIMYGTYQIASQEPGGEMMLYFTRVLHRRTDDELMDEIPTVRVDSQTPKCDNWCEFPVNDRPNAIWQWLQTDDSKLGEWLLMIETDYVFMKPLHVPTPEELSGADAISFQFGYINPSAVRQYMSRFYDGPVEDIPRSGPAPAFIKREDLIAITPLWENYTWGIENWPEAKRSLGWVREMYAYDLAAAVAGVKHKTHGAKETPLIVQPPADHFMHKAAMTHYTWGSIWKIDGKEVWRWDKRDFTAVKHVRRPKPLPLPSRDFIGKAIQHDNVPIDEHLFQIMYDEVARMNEAIVRLPVLSGPGHEGTGFPDGHIH
mmetsp:Transcript_5534/g.20170  ORF Transcript_5534/g.20170 Transcript_5534/m.20170 type:complete len:517 (-) Transcript_5534:1235-2785(-)